MAKKMIKKNEIKQESKKKSEPFNINNIKKNVIDQTPIEQSDKNSEADIEIPQKKETRGRAPKDFLNSFDFQPIDNYYKENIVTPEVEKKNTENFGAYSESNNIENDVKVEKTIESVMIEITPDKLELIESVFDAVLIKIVGVLGFNIEIEPMSEKELKVWAQITPPINLERSWKNAMFYFLLIKLSK